MPAARHHRPGPPGLAGIGGHPAARERHARPGRRAARADGGHAGQPGADLPHLRRRAVPDATDTAAMPTATEVMDGVADERAPLVSITTEDGMTHRLWRLGDPGEQAAIAADLSGRRALIADGHHRYAAYLDLQAEMRAAGLGTGPWDYGLAFLVDSAAYPPRLGAIHRVLPGLPPDRAAELAKAAFTVQDLPAGAQPGRRAAAAGRGRAGGTRVPAGRRPGVPPAQPPGSGSARRLDADRDLGAVAEPRRVGHAATAARPAVGRHRQRARRAHRPRRGRRGAGGLGRRDRDGRSRAGSGRRPGGRGYRGDLQPGVLRGGRSASRPTANGCRESPPRSAPNRAPAWSCARSARPTDQRRRGCGTMGA